MSWPLGLQAIPPRQRRPSRSRTMLALEALLRGIGRQVPNEGPPAWTHHQGEFLDQGAVGTLEFQLVPTPHANRVVE